MIVIPCGASKQAHRAIAGRMYTGSYHKACLRWALTNTDANHVYILSAKYGLLGLQDVIKPYNLVMGQPGSVTVAVVSQQAHDRGLLAADVIGIGGRKYTGVIRVVWPNADTPLDHVGGMGNQLQWMKQHAHYRNPK